MLIKLQMGKGERSNRFSFLLNVDREGACLISDGKEFLQLMWREKKLLERVNVRPMEETSLAPEDLVFRNEGVNTVKWSQLS